MTFKDEVYAVVRQIPRGSVLTYKEVAQQIGRPRAYRAVGNVLNQNRSKEVPCHRVIRSDGETGGYRDGVRAKVSILRREGALE